MVLAAVGLLLAAAAAAAAILLRPGRPRAAAMLLALALCPILIIADQWSTPQITDLRDEPATLIALALLLIATAVLAAAAAFHRWPIAVPLAIVAALPFRVPIEAGGDQANLLLPLYLVIGAAALASAFRQWQPFASASRAGGAAEGVSGPARRPVFRPASSASAEKSPGEKPSADPDTPSAVTGPARHLLLVLAAVVLLYATQTLYSPDFSKSLQNVCFFFIPFALVFALLNEVRWDRRLLKLTLLVVAASAVLFVIVGSVEYATRSLFWNDQVIRSNEFHTYFRVNSIFWDPNIYGRYLALAIAIATTALMWARDRRGFWLLTGLVAVLWIGLVPTFSQSSFAALLGGLAAIAAVRWSWRWTLGAVGAAAVLGVLVVLLAGGNGTINPTRINIDTGGRANLVSGGLDLFAQRPLWGYGAGSFPRAYRERIATKKAPVAESHTEPVTVAAEQGLIGLTAYAALLLAALWTMSRALRPEGRGGGSRAGAASCFSQRQLGESRDPPGEKPSARSGPPTPPPSSQAVARIAVLATFTALLVHTLAYAGFYEDPIMWVLLAVGSALAAGRVRTET